MRFTILTGVVVAAALVAAPATASAESATCSKATARHVAARLHWAAAPTGRTAIADVVCAPFFGPGSKGMAAAAALPSCGGSYEWAIFRFTGGSWRRVLTQRHGAILSRAGSDLREKQGAPLASDPHCFPSLWKTRVWHWNGSRFVATRWSVSPQTTLPQFLSPDRRIWCSLTDLVDVRRVWCGIEGSAEHSAALGAGGALEVCNHPPDAAVCVQNWNEDAQILRAGWQTELYGFRCTSDAQGIRCTVIATGKGFLITLGGVTPV